MYKGVIFLVGVCGFGDMMVFEVEVLDLRVGFPRSGAWGLKQVCRKKRRDGRRENQVLVSRNWGTPISTLKYSSPQYRDHKNGTPNFWEASCKFQVFNKCEGMMPTSTKFLRSRCTGVCYVPCRHPPSTSLRTVSQRRGRRPAKQGEGKS